MRYKSWFIIFDIWTKSIKLKLISTLCFMHIPLIKINNKNKIINS